MGFLGFGKKKEEPAPAEKPAEKPAAPELTEDEKEAREIYAALCKAFETHDFHCEKFEDDLTLKCGMRGEDLPFDLFVRVDAKRKLVLLLSDVGFIIPEEKRIEFAVAVCMVNDRLVNGTFDFNPRNGRLFFRMSNSYRGCPPGQEIFDYMIFTSCHTIDEYNDKFLMLSKGVTTLEQFLEADKKG